MKRTGLITINNYLRKCYETHGINAVLTAHDGVNSEEYASVSDYSFNPRKENYYIVYTGNLFEWKGIYTLIEGLNFLEKKHKLIIIGGSGREYHNVREYLKNRPFRDRVSLLGFLPRSEVLKYIEMADVLVLPNSGKYEINLYTSPLKLFEYMASKRPIVATKLPSIMEILKDGENAILCEPDNPRDMAEKIKWVLENDCSQIVKRAYEEVQEYTWEKRAERIVNFMLSVSRNG